MRTQTWRRGPLLLYWVSAALLGCSTFCFAAAPLLNWGQIAWLMLTGGICAGIASAAWGMFSAPEVAGTLKAADAERADLGGIKIRTAPQAAPQTINTGRAAWASATVRNIEAMEVPF